MKIFNSRKTMKRFADLSGKLNGAEKTKFSEDVKALFWDKNLTDNYDDFMVTEDEVISIFKNL